MRVEQHHQVQMTPLSMSIYCLVFLVGSAGTQYSCRVLMNAGLTGLRLT